MEYYERDDAEDDEDDDDDDDDLNYKMDKNNEDNENNGRKNQDLEDGKFELECDNNNHDDDDIEEAIKVLNFHGNFSLKDSFVGESENIITSDTSNNSFINEKTTTKDSGFISSSKQNDGGPLLI